MLSAAVLALVLSADAQAAPVVEREAPPMQSRWTEHWAVSIATGRTFYDSQPNRSDSNGLWQSSHRQSEIRLTRQGTPLVVGVAVHRVAYPAGGDLYAIGAGLVLGAHHSLRSWLYAELDVTLGLQRPRQTEEVAVDSPPDMGWSGPPRQKNGSPELYDRLSAGLALRAASWLEIPVRLTLHMHPLDEGRSLAAVSVGLRCLLP